MNDWLTVVLPIINAAGIPLLAFGIILLLRAFQKSTDIYKDTTIHLKDENDRLRKRLSEFESSYFNEIEKAREIAVRSMDAIQELHTIRATIKLNENKDDSTYEIEGIDSAIEILKGLSTAFKILDMKLQEHIVYSKQEFELLVSKISHSLIYIERDLRNDKGRQAIDRIISLVGSSDPLLIEKELTNLRISRGEKEERELKKFLAGQRYGVLKKIVESNQLEGLQLGELSRELLNFSEDDIKVFGKKENPEDQHGLILPDKNIHEDDE